MRSVVLDTRPPGRAPGGVTSPTNHQTWDKANQAIRAATAPSGSNNGYRKIRESLTNPLSERRKLANGQSESASDRGGVMPVGRSESPCLRQNQSTPLELADRRHPLFPKQHSEGLIRTRLQTHPMNVPTPTDSNSSLLSGHSKRTISRSNRKNQKMAPFEMARPTDLGMENLDGSQGRDNHSQMSSDIYFGADADWDTDLEMEESNEGFDVTGRAIYLESCRKNGIIPASYFLRHMTDSNLEMKHHGLGASGVKALAIALVSNTSVVKLNLADNWLGPQGGVHICEMLTENCYITHIDLSDNKLGVGFSIRFIDVLNSNNTLTHISLSGNELDDKAAGYIAEAIMATTKLESIDLSHNNFGMDAGESLGVAISENSSIKHMDLSWNCIRQRGAVAIAHGIKNNVLMQSIDLSWNGFGNDGAAALGDALKDNCTLQRINISNNRINTEGSVLFSKGLAHNDSLKILEMGKNPMQSAGCYGICAALLKNPATVIEVIDFTDILVNNDFLDLFKQLKELLPDVRLRHGGDQAPKKPKVRMHPMLKLKNYMEKHNLRLVDFFNRFDTDGSMSVTRAEFAQGIMETGIKLTPEEVEELLDELDKDGDGEINYSAISQKKSAS